MRRDLAVLGDLLSACPPALLPPGCLATAFSYHHPGRASAWYLEKNPVTSLVAEEVPTDSNVMRAISMGVVISVDRVTLLTRLPAPSQGQRWKLRVAPPEASPKATQGLETVGTPWESRGPSPGGRPSGGD